MSDKSNDKLCLELRDDFFDDETIIALESLPNGELYLNILIKMGYISRCLRVSTPWEKRSDTNGAMAHVISADNFLPGSESMTYLETIEDPAAVNDFHNMICAIDQEILHRDLFVVLNRVFNLDDRLLNAIILTGRSHTYQEIGDAYGAPLSAASEWVKSRIRRIRTSRAGHALKRKYLVEYNLSTGREKLLWLEYKDPAEHLKQLEQ